MTLDMIQQQQEASKQKGVNAANQLLRGTKQDNFLQRLRDKFRKIDKRLLLISYNYICTKSTCKSNSFS